MKQCILFGLLLFGGCCVIESEQTLPQKISQVKINGSQCQTSEKPPGSQEQLISILNKVNPYLIGVYGPPCQCGGKWRKLVDLDMSNSSQSCPNGWQLVDNNLVRGCGRQPTGCASTVFSTNTPYSKVCGQIIAVQFGTPDAFHQDVSFNVGIEGPYIDGISLTHGPSGSRQHIWSFVAANSDQTPNMLERCACSDTTAAWPYSVPSFIGNNYFCDSGQDTFSNTFTYFSDDPLWDGQGCSPTSSCCILHNPPWFCTDIGQIVSDNIEIRICANISNRFEDIIVTKMELYIQ